MYRINFNYANYYNLLTISPCADYNIREFHFSASYHLQQDIDILWIPKFQVHINAR